MKEGIAKERMKKYYDKEAVLRNFDEGSLVLLRTPDLIKREARGSMGRTFRNSLKSGGGDL